MVKRQIVETYGNRELGLIATITYNTTNKTYTIYVATQEKMLYLDNYKTKATCIKKMKEIERNYKEGE